MARKDFRVIHVNGKEVKYKLKMFPDGAHVSYWDGEPHSVTMMEFNKKLGIVEEGFSIENDNIERELTYVSTDLRAESYYGSEYYPHFTPSNVKRFYIEQILK
jgi:hypothetical protein